MTDLAFILRAAECAARAHAGQRRKGGAVPYVNHVVEVARLVAEDGQAPETVAAALLHDVVEDTDVTLDEIEARFGAEVAGLVAALTDADDWAQLSRRERKARQAHHIATAPEAARAVKIADQTSNVRDVLRLHAGWAPGEAADYVVSAEQVVDACRGVSPGLAGLFDAAAREARDAMGMGSRPGEGAA